MERGGQAGQAAVEHVAIVVVVTILLGAIGTWAVAHLRPDRPLPLAEHVLPAEPPPLGQSRLPDLGVAPTRSRGNRLVRGLRRAAGALRAAPRVAGRGVRTYAEGVAHGIGSAVGGFVRDPMATFVGGATVLSAVARDPVGFVGAQVAAGREYLHRLWTMPPGAAYRDGHA